LCFVFVLSGTPPKFSVPSSSNHSSSLHVHSDGRPVRANSSVVILLARSYLFPLFCSQLALHNFSEKVMLPFSTSILTVPAVIFHLKSISTEVSSSGSKGHQGANVIREQMLCVTFLIYTLLVIINFEFFLHVHKPSLIKEIHQPIV